MLLISSCTIRVLQLRAHLVSLFLAGALLCCAQGEEGRPEALDGSDATAESQEGGAAPGVGKIADPISPEDLDSPRALANLAASLATAGRLAEAEKAILQALDRSPDSPALLAELAGLRLALGKDAEALPVAVRAADLARGSDARLYLLATSTRLRLHQLDEATVDLERWEKDHGSSPLLSVARGLVHESAGRMEDAARAYESALEADPTCPEALSGLVKLSFERGDPEAALAALRQAEAAGVAPHIWEGQALRRLGRLEEAESAYRAALTLEPEHPVALADLGALRARRGDYAGARPLLERALEIQPNLTSARANLDEVDRLLAGSESPSPPTP